MIPQVRPKTPLHSTGVEQNLLRRHWYAKENSSRNVRCACDYSTFIWMMPSSGWLNAKLHAQEKGSDQAPAGGAQVLPVPDQRFNGVMGRKAKESKPDSPKVASAPKDAPNILLIMTDDTGFGASSTFGGPIPTPTLDRVAANGINWIRMQHAIAPESSF
jgi:hypothetical protein